jgi:ABC-type transport system involved in multi-copper enzyme maturation permease subunit
MRDRILAIAANGWRELDRKRAPLVLVLVFVLAWFLPLLIQFKLMDTFASHAGSSEKIGRSILYLDKLVLFLGMMISVIYASQMVEAEVSRPTLVSVMVRPVRSWEYLLGRFIAPITLYFLFVLILVFGTHIVFPILGAEVPAGFELGVAQRCAYGVGIILTAGALGTLFSSSALSVLAVFAIYTLSMLVGAVSTDLPAAIAAVMKTMHYLTPVRMNTDFFANEAAAFSPEWTEALIWLENVLYGVTAFLLADWVFRHRDVPVRDRD